MMRGGGVIALLLLAACTPVDQRADTATAPPAWRPDVEVHGQLRDILHEGALGATVRLDRYLPDRELYALGAAGGLDGEITVVAGDAWISRPTQDGRVETTRAEITAAGAALLVVSRVPAWQELTVPRAIRWHELDDTIEELAREAGMPPGRRFPFLLEGEFHDLEWHVVDGRRLPEGPSSHEEHQAAGIRLSRQRVQATLLGFFSERDTGVFTHLGRRTHVHCTLQDPFSSGHVDGVEIPAGTVLRLPQVDRR